MVGRTQGDPQSDPRRAGVTDVTSRVTPAAAVDQGGAPRTVGAWYSHFPCNPHLTPLQRGQTMGRVSLAPIRDREQAPRPRHNLRRLLCGRRAYGGATRSHWRPWE